MDPNVNSTTPQQPAVSTINPEPKKRSMMDFVRSKKFLVIALVIIILLVVAYILVVNISRTGGSEIEDTSLGNNNTLMASVGDRDIYRSNVEAVALEQYAPEAITDEVIEVFLPITIERVILEIEAEQKQINLERGNLPDYYDKLKDQVTSGQIEKIEAYDISWWIPPADEYEQLPEFPQQRADTARAVPQIVTALRANEDPVAVVERTITQFPSLAGLIGLNGGQFATTEDKSAFQTPRTHTYNEQDQQKFFYQELFKMEQAGSVEGFIWPNGSGAAIIKVVSISAGEPVDYETWIDQKKSELVSYY